MHNHKLKEFQDLLASIYGSKALASLTDSVNDNKLKLKNPEVLSEFLTKHHKSIDDGCQNCRKLFPKNSFLNRKMDFPSWLGLLDFDKKHIKQLMIIGEDVSPKVPYSFNIAYGLGRYSILKNGIIAEEKRNKLWIQLKAMFDEELDLVLKNVYVTDICKCNAKKKGNIWDNCSSNFLLKEIELINPKIVIFQGNTAYEYTKSILGDKMNEEDITLYFGNNSFPKFGKISLSNNEIWFMRIYHTSNANQRFNHLNKEEGFKKMVKERVLPMID
jgi:hypothetical protein